MVKAFPGSITVTKPSAVLFACTMNSIRSPMAESLMKHFHGSEVFVDSVGVRTREIDGFDNVTGLTLSINSSMRPIVRAPVVAPADRT